MSRAVFTANHAVAVAADRLRLSPTLVVQRHKGWAKVHEEGACRMCRRPSSVRPLTRHHIVPLSYFRRRPAVAPLRHADANVIPLCAPCHKLVEKRSSHARIELRRVLGTAEFAFALRITSREWFDARYPNRPPAPV